ncbi:MAG TPA: phosphoglucomutase/phosphomannomutase family protein [Methylomirabilota bacterium]|nr:phosphoglucomutase/phosphomannomutase family protein [Methylomirabilota bacterium]
MTSIKFGTDGWRAVMADEFTFANVERVAQATARHWLAQPPPGSRPLVVIGYDRRFLSDRFARRAAEVFSGNGLEVLLTAQPTPTPAVSWAVRQRGAVGGVMITASHNPPEFNGYKLKAHYGGPAEADLCRAIEAELDQDPIRKRPLNRNPGVRVVDLRPAHYHAIKKRVDFRLIARSGLRLAHDAMYGVGAGCFETLLEGTSCRVTTLRTEHNPSFGGINPEPVARNYAATIAFLRRHPHDVCLVTDGDADRLGGLDGRGGCLSAHTLICLLLYHLVAHRGGRGRVVKALTTTSMVDKMCAAYGLELVETGVGFKHIGAEMRRGGVLLGAEESGSIGFPGHIPERDGLLAGLMLLELLATERVSVRRLVARLDKTFGPHYSDRIDCALPLERRDAVMEWCRRHPPARLLRSPVVDVRTHDGVKLVTRDGSWLMLRGSGTEPVLRIYAEAATEAGLRGLLQFGRRLVLRS